MHLGRSRVVLYAVAILALSRPCPAQADLLSTFVPNFWYSHSPGGDPHNFHPSPYVSSLGGAGGVDLSFQNGHGGFRNWKYEDGRVWHALGDVNVRAAGTYSQFYAGRESGPEIYFHVNLTRYPDGGPVAIHFPGTVYSLEQRDGSRFVVTGSPGGDVTGSATIDGHVFELTFRPVTRFEGDWAARGQPRSFVSGYVAYAVDGVVEAPEPGTLAMAALGLAGLGSAGLRRLRSRRAA
jgi:hypothetical protein